MKEILSLVTSSLHDLRCCDESVTVALGWRALTSSITCLLDSAAHNTGRAHVATLQQYTIATGLATGITKANSPSDPNYIADYSDLTLCPLPTVEVPDPVGTSVIEVHNNTTDMTVTVVITASGQPDRTINVFPHGSSTVSIAAVFWNVNVVSNAGVTNTETIVNGDTIPLNPGEHHDFGDSTPIIVTVNPR